MEEPMRTDLVAVVKRGLRSQAYLREVLAALDEHLGEATKEGDATRMEMYMAAMILVEDRMRAPRKGG